MPFDRTASQKHLRDAVRLLEQSATQYHSHIKLASSFGLEDVVLIDMLSKIKPVIPVFTLDTGRLNEETYEVMDRIRARYGIAIESYFPDAAKVEALERAKGFYSFRQSVENRKECCGIRKVEPLGRALAGLQAWVTGLRRGQSVTRAGVQQIEKDEISVGAPLVGAQGGDKPRPYIIKINPLADWTLEQVWDYVKKNQVPYNRLHDQGYPSIGCAPCTRAVGPAEDLRAGRWWWENPEHKECGIHLPKK